VGLPAGARPDRERVINSILAKIDDACLSEEMLAKPTEHYVSTSDLCNIACHYCPRQSYYGDRWQNGFFPFEQFDERLVPLARAAELMGLYGLGEPFLHRRFFDFVDASREAGSRTMTNSHGMSLKPKVNDRILESGLTQLNISFDGATPETFNHLRDGADFDTVVSQVRDLTDRRRRTGAKGPELFIATMINRENVHEVPDIVRLARDLDAQQVHLSDTVICNAGELDRSVSWSDQMNDRVAEAKALGKEFEIPVHYTCQKPYPWRPFRPDELKPEPMACRSANANWLVGKEGEVKPCCFIEWEYGNVFRDDPEEIQNGEAARALRRSLMSGDLMRECRHCGSARPLTEDLQRSALDEAEAMLEASAPGGGEEIDLRRLIAERRTLVDQRWAGGVDHGAVERVTHGAHL
jgi:radical SAM protein with 4Fe4S-binding SPASM domain